MPPFPVPGLMMPDIRLESPDGPPVRISDFRQRRIVVLVFLDGADEATRARILPPLAARHAEFRREDTEILAVLQGDAAEARRLRESLALPFPVLSDADREAHRSTGVLPQESRSGPSALVVDRYGQVFFARRSGGRRAFPSPDELLEWVRYIENQCPE